jgi:two-component system, chemotaxis family, CheB/CheR fusion protein
VGGACSNRHRGSGEPQFAEASAVLHRTIVELEATNEELDVANEELRVSNEELERLNDALEASHKELRSVAEELVSVNGELLHRMEDGAAERQEFASLLLHVGDAAIFVSPSGTIGHFTETAARLFGLGPTDVGRPIDVLGGLELGSLVNEALRERTSVLRRGMGADGEAYVIRAEVPSDATAIAGVLLRIEPDRAAGAHGPK